LVLAFTEPAHAQISKDAKLLASFKPVVLKASESTVRIKCDDKDAVLGTVVDANGYILTKLSELKGTLLARLPDGSEYPATIVAAHKPTALAVLMVENTGLMAVQFVASKKLEAGSWLASSGPNSDPVSAGIVSVMTRKTTGRDAVILNPFRGYLGIYPDDEKDPDGRPSGAKVAAVAPAGPASKAGLTKDDIILELNGQKVDSSTGLREILDNMKGGDVIAVKAKRKGEVRDFKVKLGSAAIDRIGITPEDEKDASGNLAGTKVVSVTPFSSAAKAGLLSGDVIVEVNGKKVQSQTELREILDTFKLEELVNVKVSRKGATKDFRVSIEPTDRSEYQNSRGSELSRRRTGFAEVLQTDMVVNAKDCGGPVVDLDGKVLGINIARAGRVETWVLPSEVIKPLLPDFKAGKFAPPPPKVLPVAPAPRPAKN